MDRKNRAILWIAASWLFLTGCEKIEPGAFSDVEKAAFNPSQTASAQVRAIDQWYEAVGTVRPRTETRIEARVTGQVLSVKVRPGDRVAKGTLLVALDSRQTISRLNQAKQALKTAQAGREQARHALDAARAGFKQARANYQRIKTYHDSQAATAQELEAAESTFRQAEAGVKRAEEGITAAEAGMLQARAVVKESAISLEYSRILAPEDGIVLKRFVEPGDLALPGKPLVALRTTGALRLEAYVREGLIEKVAPGTALEAAIDTLDTIVDATVMFGKLRVPVGSRRIVTIPAAAVRRVGQLELVHVKSGDRWQIRHVKTGVRLKDASIEILSGLDGSEAIGWGGADNG